MAKNNKCDDQRLKDLRVIIVVSEQHPTSVSQYKKHLKNVGPIRHCEPPHVPFTMCRYCRMPALSHDACTSMSTTTTTTTTTCDKRGPLWPLGMGPTSQEMWPNSRAFASDPIGRGFESRPVRFYVTALGKLLTKQCRLIDDFPLTWKYHA